MWWQGCACLPKTSIKHTRSFPWAHLSASWPGEKTELLLCITHSLLRGLTCKQLENYQKLWHIAFSFFFKILFLIFFFFHFRHDLKLNPWTTWSAVVWATTLHFPANISNIEYNLTVSCKGNCFLITTHIRPVDLPDLYKGQTLGCPHPFCQIMRFFFSFSHLAAQSTQLLQNS